MSIIYTKTYPAPPIDEREILRYAGCQQAEQETLTLLREAVREGEQALSYKVCYTESPVTLKGDFCDFGAFSVRSQALSKRLDGCERVVIFAATIGLGLDRLLQKYGKLSPAKALLLQAFGTERIEALCDAFCQELAQQSATRARFSVGYGDLALETQKTVLSILDASKKIGVGLSDGLLMSPSKSVTAFVGLGGTVYAMNEEKCRVCDQENCSFRKDK